MLKNRVFKRFKNPESGYSFGYNSPKKAASRDGLTAFKSPDLGATKFEQIYGIFPIRFGYGNADDQTGDGAPRAVQPERVQRTVKQAHR